MSEIDGPQRTFEELSEEILHKYLSRYNLTKKEVKAVLSGLSEVIYYDIDQNVNEDDMAIVILYKMGKALFKKDTSDLH